MVKTLYRKFEKRLIDYLIFLLLILIVFGQLPGFFVDRFDVLPFTLHLLDLVVSIIAVMGIFLNTNKPVWTKSMYFFVLWAAFTFIFHILSQNASFSFISLLYLFRLCVYIFLFTSLSSYIKDKEEKLLLYNSLIAVGVAVAILGWIQYFIIPDLRSLKMLGWDDHYFRLVSTYLDPAFTGIMLVLAETLVVNKLLRRFSRSYMLVGILLLISIGFTYSRSSFLSLFIAVIFLMFKYSYMKLVFAFALIFLLLIPLLPRKIGGEGVKLERLHSLFLKVDNYKKGFEVFKTTPLIGVGYNNICALKASSSEQNKLNNACSGLDNSFLFVLVATGSVGGILFLSVVFDLVRSTNNNNFGTAWSASMVAITVHAFFTNTIFYSWVLVWIAILTAISRRSQSKMKSIS